VAIRLQPPPGPSQAGGARSARAGLWDYHGLQFLVDRMTSAWLLANGGDLLFCAALPVFAFKKRVDDLDVMIELIDAGSPEEKEEYSNELTAQVVGMVPELEQIEIGVLFTGQFDRNNAIFSI
jgi:hypothetical protein